MRPLRADRTVRALQIAVRGLVAVAVVAAVVAAFAYGSDHSCAEYGLKDVVQYPTFVSAVSALAGLAVGAALLLVGLWSNWRGAWWWTLLLVPVGLGVASAWFVVAVGVCGR